MLSSILELVNKTQQAFTHLQERVRPQNNDMSRMTTFSKFDQLAEMRQNAGIPNSTFAFDILWVFLLLIYYNIYVDLAFVDMVKVKFVLFFT